MKQLFKILVPICLALFLAESTQFSPHTSIMQEIDGGASNHNFVIKTENTSYFMRISDQGKNTLSNEYQCAIIASEAGIAPAVVSYSPKQNILITEFIPSHAAINLHDEKTILRTAEILRKLHAIQQPFSATTDPCESVYTLCKQVQIVPEAFETQVLPAIRQIETMLDDYTATPCHLDLHKGNLIDDGQQLWIIDWEYAAMSDPFFDLAILAATERYTDAQMEFLLKAYLPEVTSEDWSHLYLLRIVADARWAIWSFRQVKTSTIDYPYEEEGTRFLESCLKRIEIACDSHL